MKSYETALYYFSLYFAINGVLCIEKLIDEIEDKEAFTITTDGCTIPGFALISENLRELLKTPAITPNCSQNPPLVSTNASHIWVLQVNYDYYNIWDDSHFFCCYSNFSAHRNAKSVSYGHCEHFSVAKKVHQEFIRVECYYFENKVYEDFFLFPVIHKHTLSKKKREAAYNVVLLGIENMSRLNFLRTMPKTAQFLQEKGSVQLLGYNKVGANTCPNLFPLLMGDSFDYVKKVCIENNVIDTDKHPFLWDRYKSIGYYTALGADSSAGILGIYENMLTKKPTDFYLAPFISETRKLFKNQRVSYNACFGSKLYFKTLLQYIKYVVNAIKHEKFFGVFWEESITHHYQINNARLLDDHYFELLSYMDKSRFLDKTILVLFSDHGMRWGKIAQTPQGRMEERLPLMNLLFPKDFRHVYRIAYKNFINNSHRLTTPYDMYETLLDLIDTKNLEDYRIQQRLVFSDAESKRISLFLPVSEKRTCESSGIEEHWCTCHKGEKVPAGYRSKEIAAQYLMDHINMFLKRLPQCQQLKIKEILDVTVSKNRNVSGHTYTVVIRAWPGGAIFDGTLIRDRGTWSVSGAVSRLNLYGDQSCVKDDTSKMYCICK